MIPVLLQFTQFENVLNVPTICRINKAVVDVVFFFFTVAWTPVMAASEKFPLICGEDCRLADH